MKEYAISEQLGPRMLEVCLSKAIRTMRKEKENLPPQSQNPNDLPSKTLEEESIIPKYEPAVEQEDAPEPPTKEPEGSGNRDKRAESQKVPVEATLLPEKETD